MNRNGANIGMLALIFLVLACGCPGRLRELARKQPPSERETPVSVSPTSPVDSPDSVPYNLSRAQYGQIKVGSKRSEVESILGGPGSEISSSTGGGVNFSVNKWDGGNFQSVIITFRNDKVMSKSQVGLK